MSNDIIGGNIKKGEKTFLPNSSTSRIYEVDADGNKRSQKQINKALDNKAEKAMASRVRCLAEEYQTWLSNTDTSSRPWKPINPDQLSLRDDVDYMIIDEQGAVVNFQTLYNALLQDMVAKAQEGVLNASKIAVNELFPKMTKEEYEALSPEEIDPNKYYCLTASVTTE